MQNNSVQFAYLSVFVVQLPFHECKLLKPLVFAFRVLFRQLLYDS